MFPKCGQNVKEVCPKGNFLDFAFDTIITVKGETIIKKKKQNSKEGKKQSLRRL